MHEGQAARVLTLETRNASNALRAARVAEMVLIAMSTFTLVLACSVLSAERSTELHDLMVALLCAALAAGAWGWTHRVTERAMALRVDERLGLGGAYLTAWEVARGELPRTPVASLLESRIAGGVPRGRIVRVALPRSMYWVAGPFLGGAILALALQEVREVRESADPVVSTRALATGLRDLRSSAGFEGNLEPAGLEALEELRSQAESLAQVALDEDPEAQERMREELDALGEKLNELASAAPTDSSLRSDLERAQVLADQARMALERQLPLAENPGADGNSRANPVGERGSRVSSAETPGTIPGSQEAVPDTPSTSSPGRDPSLSSGPPSSPGVFSRGRWWPARHDELVASWVEARRNSD